MEQVLKEKPNSSDMSPGREIASAITVEDATNRLNATSMAEKNSGQTLQLGSVGLRNHVPVGGQQAVWKPKAYGTVSEAAPVEVEKAPADHSATAEKSSAALSKLFKSNILENFTVDNFTYSLAQIRATFYPKFENEKSDQEVICFHNILLCYLVLMRCVFTEYNVFILDY